jgi:hypothetical protein
VKCKKQGGMEIVGIFNFFLLLKKYLKARESYKFLIYNNNILIKKMRFKLSQNDVMSERFFANDNNSSCN